MLEREIEMMVEDKLLENPVWHALTSQQSDIKIGQGLAVRFPQKISRFVGMEAPTNEGFSDLAAIVATGETVALMTFSQPIVPDGWKIIRSRALVQMTYSGPKPDTFPSLVQLTASDVPEMLALAEATQPGPFLSETISMGSYFGIRSPAGKLVAMAGERLRLDDYTEISAVCTDPAFRGHGYAKMLVHSLVFKAVAENRTAFLHVKGEISAKSLYEKLGFIESRCLQLTVVQRM